jgi:hypothetical protein
MPEKGDIQLIELKALIVRMAPSPFPMTLFSLPFPANLAIELSEEGLFMGRRRVDFRTLRRSV